MKQTTKLLSLLLALLLAASAVVSAFAADTDDTTVDYQARQENLLTYWDQHEKLRSLGSKTEKYDLPEILYRGYTYLMDMEYGEGKWDSTTDKLSTDWDNGNNSIYQVFYGKIRATDIDIFSYTEDNDPANVKVALTVDHSDPSNITSSHYKMSNEAARYDTDSLLLIDDFFEAGGKNTVYCEENGVFSKLPLNATRNANAYSGSIWNEKYNQKWIYAGQYDLSYRTDWKNRTANRSDDYLAAYLLVSDDNDKGILTRYFRFFPEMFQKYSDMYGEDFLEKVLPYYSTLKAWNNYYYGTIEAAGNKASGAAKGYYSAWNYTPSFSEYCELVAASYEAIANDKTMTKTSYKSGIDRTKYPKVVIDGFKWNKNERLIDEFAYIDVPLTDDDIYNLNNFGVADNFYREWTEGFANEFRLFAKMIDRKEHPHDNKVYNHFNVRRDNADITKVTDVTEVTKVTNVSQTGVNTDITKVSYPSTTKADS